MTTKETAQTGIGPQFLAGFYGGKFEDAMNVLFSPTNIRTTVTKILELEKQYGPYEVGKFNKYLLPPDIWPDINGKTTDAQAFENDFSQVPQVLRDRVSAVMRANIHSNAPLPVLYRTSDNVDKVHDVVIKPFVYNDIMYIGVLYLCPNRKMPPT